MFFFKKLKSGEKKDRDVCEKSKFSLKSYVVLAFSAHLFTERTYAHWIAEKIRRSTTKT
jgi:hypothetical protein